ncbi:MAG: hypothetical protein IPJ08_14175 [Burkholderiales bacterium]|nr:hypothetical protein [Burkholderiales bacterium]
MDLNDAPTMAGLVDMGVDGLITDRGDIAQQAAGRQGCPWIDGPHWIPPPLRHSREGGMMTAGACGATGL